MRTTGFSLLAAMTLTAGFVWAQQAQQKAAPSAAPVAKGTMPKKEYDAYMAVVNEQDPDKRVKKADEFITTYADAEPQYKSLVLYMAAEGSDRKGDQIKAMAYAQSALESDSMNFEAMLLLSGELARGTKENDLDKVEKLAKAEKLATDAITGLPNAAKPNPKTSDGAWENYKKDQIAQGHVDLGMIALARKKNDLAVAEFKQAVDGSSTPDPIPMLRLADAYNKDNKPDDALAVVNKVLAMPDLNPQLKQFAENQKSIAQSKKK